MDRDLLARAYDRSAEDYDARFRELQREKYRAVARLLEPCSLPAGPVLDAGGGTGLFAEWLADCAEPADALRDQLRARTLIVLDASIGMLRKSASRAPLRVAADLVHPPFRKRFALVVAFTSVLGKRDLALSALAALVAPDGLFALTLLSGESPSTVELARICGLRDVSGMVRAGQDVAFLLHRR